MDHSRGHRHARTGAEVVGGERSTAARSAGYLLGADLALGDAGAVASS